MTWRLQYPICQMLLISFDELDFREMNLKKFEILSPKMLSSTMSHKTNYDVIILDDSYIYNLLFSSVHVGKIIKHFPANR